MVTNSAGYEKGTQLKQLKFRIGYRSYILEFRGYRVLKLCGDSATGKSLFASDLNKYEGDLGQFGTNEHVLVLSMRNRAALSMITDGAWKRYTLVVIDNADVLLTPQIEEIIKGSILDPENDTYWVIIGRKFHSCCPTGLSSATLKMEVDKANKTCKIWNEFIDDARMSYYANKERKFL